MINYSTENYSECCYLHGALQMSLGTDIVGTKSERKVGVEYCTVNNEYSCISFTWKRTLGLCTLICSFTDTEAITWCLYLYLDKAEFV